MRAELADGRILEFPDGTDPMVIQSTVKKMLGGQEEQPQQQPTPMPVPQPASQRQANPLENMSAGGQLAAFAEPALTVGSSLVAEPVAGLAGIAQSLNPFAEEGAGTRAVEATREALTYQPKTPEGQATLGEVGGVLEPVGEAISSFETGLGDFTFDMTGSPTLSAAAASTPTIIGELIGLKGLKSLRRGERLLENGRPTKALRKELDKAGLDFDNLSPEVQKLVPENVTPELLPGAKPIRKEVENTIIQQIKAGGREDALATLKVDGGSLKVDKLGTEAVKQGFSPGAVQAIKTSNPATKAKMQVMARKMRQINRNERIALDTRPSDVVGDAVSNRISFIADKTESARKELNNIARTQLNGVDVDPSAVLTTFKESMDNLGVKFQPTSDGKLIPNFKNSRISEDMSSQRAIKSVFRLMGKGGKPDALRFHHMKQELDNMIDFNKKSSMGLSKSGEKVAKSMRKTLNESLRGINKEYANVNDVMSMSLGTMNDLDKAVGSIDIFGKGADKALGQRMRALMSNQQGRVKIENAIDQINDTTKQLGGVFDEDIKDLAMFANTLDEKFGAVAKTSFAGQVEQGVANAMTRPPKATMIDAIGRGIGKGTEKLRGVNKFNAFESLDALLK